MIRPTPSMASTLVDAFERALRARETVSWPSERWRTDVVGFARDVLGIELWAKQIEIARAVQDHAQVAVRSGHKCGKSTLAAVLALWYYCSFADARVILTSKTARQVDGVLWREIRRLKTRARMSIDGELHELARSGLRSGLREIWGFTADTPEATAGISGANLLFIFDEASGIDDSIWEAMSGNAAGGAKVFAISNPTRTEGWFFKAFHQAKDYWKTYAIASTETPNVVLGKNVILGLADVPWIEQKRAEWGEDSREYRVRVKGEFALGEDGKIVSLDAISRAAARWQNAQPSGPLQIGIDPAGATGRGDHSAFVVRRGGKVIDVLRQRGLTPEAHLVTLEGLLAQHRRAREHDTLVVYDREGPAGWDLLTVIRAHAEKHGYRAVGLRSSDRARRLPGEYMRIRDELWYSAAKWLAAGAIPPDTQLQEELHAPEWKLDVTGKLRASPKEDLRSLLGRSPDSADALCLAVWVPDQGGGERVEGRQAPQGPPVAPDVLLDPYEGGAAFDPYRG